MPDTLMSATVVAVILLVLVSYIALIRAIMSPRRDADHLSDTMGPHISR